MANIASPMSKATDAEAKAMGALAQPSSSRKLSGCAGRARYATRGPAPRETPYAMKGRAAAQLAINVHDNML